jgi:type I restriction enzyme S subunit
MAEQNGFPLVPLGEVLSRSEEWIDLNPTESYQEVTVRMWGNGVVLRREAAGSEIAASRRLRVHTDQFIISRIDARHGASGLIPPELDGAIVSNDFPVFNLEQARILPTFLKWLSKTRGFIDLCLAASEGTTNRVRLQEKLFLTLEIPLPPLHEQRRIVARIEELAARIAEARGLRAQAAEEAEALSKSYLDSIYTALEPRYGTNKLSDICTTITDGDHMTPAFLQEGVKFIFVGNVSSGHLHFHGCKHVDPGYYAKLTESRKPKRDDILYSAVGATLGIPAIVCCDEDFCFQRHVAILKPAHDKILSRFLWYILQSRTIYTQAWAMTTGSAQPTVPLRAIKSFNIPLPPLPEQRRIVAYLDDLQARVDAVKRLQADTAAELDALLPAVLDRAFRGAL